MVSTATLAPTRLGGVLELADRSVTFRELGARLEEHQRVSVADATAGARAFAWSALVAQNARTVALVAPSEDRARRWRAELTGWLGEDRVLAFPPAPRCISAFSRCGASRLRKRRSLSSPACAPCSSTPSRRRSSRAAVG